jgi:hypothetical protein
MTTVVIPDNDDIPRFLKLMLGLPIIQVGPNVWKVPGGYGGKLEYLGSEDDKKLKSILMEINHEKDN